MYSLYRAWLTPPDVLVHVGAGGGRPFAAHRSVLAAHSGYLKALIAGGGAEPLTVASVSPEAFAPLLSFMYTGYLELTADNIYSVLLATHLLHMPRALELCRAFLLQHQAPTLPPLVRPVPSRKLPPPLWPYPPPPPPPLLLPSSTESSPFRAVVRPSSPLPSTSRHPSPPRSSSPQSSDASPPPPPPKAQSATPSGKVIVDVACCDGPVRFHRVLNDNYGLTMEEIAAREEEDRRKEEEAVPKQKEADKVSSSETVYTCLYCNHTFKSHYCYQKHARRHINPVTLDMAKAKARREVRLLDMNVQYYPCKTCGSKFPSYYFVHKHRKLCHANEDSSSEESHSQPATATA